MNTYKLIVVCIGSNKGNKFTFFLNGNEFKSIAHQMLFLHKKNTHTSDSLINPEILEY